jgi:ATP-dependent DNA helicase RecG
VDGTELSAMLAKLRRLGGEPANIELKTAAGGLPRSVVETVSAFSNTNGGLIVLGVDESEGFAPVRLPAPAKLRDDLVSAASDQLVPPVCPHAQLIEVDGTVLVVAEIDPWHPISGRAT